MTNIALNTRASSAPIFASAAILAGVDFVERCGVVLRRSEYSVPRHEPVQSPLIGTHDLRRVVFIVRLDGGIGSEIVTIDQTLDAVSALIQKDDQIVVTLVDDVHVEPTVSPIFPWADSKGVNVEGRVLRSGKYLNSNGRLCTSTLVLGDKGLVVVSPDSESDREEVSYRVGVIQRRSEYTRERHMPLNVPLISTKDARRVSFVVRLDGGIGSEGITIDQTLDATSALLQEGDQVQVKLVDNVHVESTVAPIFAWGDEIDDTGDSAVSFGRVLRTGEFPNSKGVPCVASLVLADAPSRGLVVAVKAA
ncbi:hypothetical protein BH10CYA1_BH10CYA1_60840 [soil metagenome]